MAGISGIDFGVLVFENLLHNFIVHFHEVTVLGAMSTRVDLVIRMRCLIDLINQ